MRLITKTKCPNVFLFFFHLLFLISRLAIWTFRFGKPDSTISVLVFSLEKIESAIFGTLYLELYFQGGKKVSSRGGLLWSEDAVIILLRQNVSGKFCLLFFPSLCQFYCLSFQIHGRWDLIKGAAESLHIESVTLK